MVVDLVHIHRHRMPIGEPGNFYWRHPLTINASQNASRLERSRDRRLYHLRTKSVLAGTWR